MFRDGRHGLIIEAIRSVGAQGDTADLLAVIKHLNDAGTLESAGGAGYLQEIVDRACMNGAYRFDEYVRVLRSNEECRISAARGMPDAACRTANAGGELSNGERRVTNGPVAGSALASANGDDRREVTFQEVEPWPEPVDGAELLNQLRALVVRYVVLPEGAAEILALWILHTYAYRLRRVTTYLGIVSPEKRCGKTTLLTVLSEVANRALLASNVSPPAIFRAIEEVEPALLIDEGDTFLRGKDPIGGILNAGYTRESAYVLRAMGEGQKLARFSCWCPKVIASIGDLPETLADRCIVIVMKRKSPEQTCERFRGLTDNSLARKCARFVVDHGAEIGAAQPDIPEGLNDRAADIREPLLALADLAGGEWPAFARKAVAPSDPAAMDLTALLLKDVRMIFQISGLERMRSREVVKLLISAKDRAWARLRDGGPIDDRWLAGKLRPFGIRPKVIRTGGLLGRGYYGEDFERGEE